MPMRVLIILIMIMSRSPACLAAETTTAQRQTACAEGNKDDSESAELSSDITTIALKQMAAIRDALAAYRVVFKENPVGTNAEITRTLTGKNPRNATFLKQTRVVMNKGELMDPWGKPYFFHQISSKVMEIRSAGPDRGMWNQDDLTTR